MAAINRLLVPLLFGLISSFSILLQLQVAYINLQADYARRRLVVMRLISLPVNKTVLSKRLIDGDPGQDQVEPAHGGITKMAANSLIFQ